MSKQYYRKLLNELKPIIKLSACCEQVGISKSNLSHFLKGEPYDMCVSVDKLELLVDYIKNSLSVL